MGRKALERDQGETGQAMMSERVSETNSSKDIVASLMDEGGQVRKL